MNPFDLDASDLMIWGLVAHLVADWLFQNDWMVTNKAKRRQRWRFGDGMTNPAGRRYYATSWWDRHPAALVHAGIHGIFLAFVFGWAAAPLALVHLIIDTRWPVAKWAELIKQTPIEIPPPLVDVGMTVRFWTDQVFHIFTIAIAALVIGAL